MRMIKFISSMSFAIFTLSLFLATANIAKAEEEIILSPAQWEMHQRLLGEISRNKSKCHIEYRNCYIDYEYRCTPISGGTVNCVQVPVRRCGKPERVCD